MTDSPLAVNRGCAGRWVECSAADAPHRRAERNPKADQHAGWPRRPGSALRPRWQRTRRHQRRCRSSKRNAGAGDGGEAEHAADLGTTADAVFHGRRRREPAESATKGICIGQQGRAGVRSRAGPRNCKHRHRSRTSTVRDPRSGRQTEQTPCWRGPLAFPDHLSSNESALISRDCPAIRLTGLFGAPEQINKGSADP